MYSRPKRWNCQRLSIPTLSTTGQHRSRLLLYTSHILYVRNEGPNIGHYWRSLHHCRLAAIDPDPTFSRSSRMSASQPLQSGYAILGTHAMERKPVGGGGR